MRAPTAIRRLRPLAAQARAVRLRKPDPVQAHWEMVERLGAANLEFPSHLDIETTAVCNLKCPMCPRTTMMTRPTGHMPMKLFRRIIDEAGQHELDLVWLHLFGEPLLNPRMLDYVEYAKRYPSIHSVGFSTNATVLSERRAHQILDSGLDRIILALDAATPEAYAFARGGKFDKTMQNAARFLDLHRARDSRIQVEISLIPMKFNTADEQAFRDRWGKYESDRVSILLKPFSDFAGQVEYYGTHGAPVVGDPNRVPCHVLSYSLTIMYNGDVVPCCFDADATMPLGNIQDEGGIQGIWRGAALERIRAAHNALDFTELPLCAHCEWTCAPS
jgi:radical SAM protein with 4Fe4S-binding SPASM domain